MFLIATGVPIFNLVSFLNVWREHAEAEPPPHFVPCSMTAFSCLAYFVTHAMQSQSSIQITDDHLHSTYAVAKSGTNLFCDRKEGCNRACSKILAWFRRTPIKSAPKKAKSVPAAYFLPMLSFFWTFFEKTDTVQRIQMMKR
jgi:hypothetical protein